MPNLRFSGPMNCPKCKSKMIFDKKIKDYYCANCEKSLKDLEEYQTVKTTQKEEDIEKTDTEQIIKPELDTVKGIKFMLFGALILLLTPILMLICPVFSVIGLLLLILGFFLVYRDKKRYSKNERIH